MKQFKDVERQVICILENVLKRYAPTFEALGIRVGLPEIELWKSTPDDYESEFRVMFWRDKDLVNVVEDHVFKKGKQVAELEKIESWIEEDVAEVARLAQDGTDAFS